MSKQFVSNQCESRLTIVAINHLSSFGDKMGSLKHLGTVICGFDSLTQLSIRKSVLCGLNSIIALLLGFLQYKIHTEKLVVPIFNCTETNFPLRTENYFVLKPANVDKDYCKEWRILLVWGTEQSNIRLSVFSKSSHIGLKCFLLILLICWFQLLVRFTSEINGLVYLVEAWLIKNKIWFFSTNWKNWFSIELHFDRRIFWTGAGWFQETWKYSKYTFGSFASNVLSSTASDEPFITRLGTPVQHAFIYKSSKFQKLTAFFPTWRISSLNLVKFKNMKITTVELHSGRMFS